MTTAFITLTRAEASKTQLVNIANIQAVEADPEGQGSLIWFDIHQPAMPLIVKETPSEVRNFLRVAGCKVVG